MKKAWVIVPVLLILIGAAVFYYGRSDQKAVSQNVTTAVNPEKIPTNYEECMQPSRGEASSNYRCGWSYSLPVIRDCNSISCENRMITDTTFKTCEKMGGTINYPLQLGFSGGDNDESVTCSLSYFNHNLKYPTNYEECRKINNGSEYYYKIGQYCSININDSGVFGDQSNLSIINKLISQCKGMGGKGESLEVSSLTLNPPEKEVGEVGLGYKKQKQTNCTLYFCKDPTANQTCTIDLKSN